MLNRLDKFIVFLFTSPFEPVTSMCLYLRSLEMTRSQGYILFLASVLANEQRRGKIPVVKECPDVFTKDILKFLP